MQEPSLRMQQTVTDLRGLAEDAMDNGSIDEPLSNRMAVGIGLGLILALTVVADAIVDLTAVIQRNS